MKLIVVGGPTAAGKTKVAIEVARHFNTEIISADSRQFYREMAIGNARPTEAELAAVPHHFVADRSLTEPLSAGRFAALAMQRIEQLSGRLRSLVVVGGSGLYLRALCQGLDEFPEITEGARTQVRSIRETEGLRGLQQRLQAIDPTYYGTVDVQNGRRLERALLVSLSGSQPYSSYLGKRPPRPFSSCYFALHLERADLYRRIEDRIDRMLDAGLEEEAKRLLPHRHEPVLQTVGYQEWWTYFDGNGSRQETIRRIKRNSRRYAKRQTTWFRTYRSVAGAREIIRQLERAGGGA